MVSISEGESVEFLMAETLAQLEEIRAASAHGWNAARRFSELGRCLKLKLDAREAFDEIVQGDYPDPANKTNANYEELCKKIITKLSDHEYPGDEIMVYLNSHVKYMRCKMTDGSGRVEKPNKVLSRLQHIRNFGKAMHHNHGIDYITNVQMTMYFWNIFPQSMKNWLRDEQNIDPFDQMNPLDAQEIADHMQRYWNSHLKNEKKKEGSNRNKQKRDDEDGDSSEL